MAGGCRAYGELAKDATGGGCLPDGCESLLAGVPWAPETAKGLSTSEGRECDDYL